MRRTLGVALGTALSLALAAPAYAGQLTLKDPAGDVLVGRVDLPGGYARESNVREGDVVRTTVKHGPHNVVVTSTFRTLDQVGTYHGYYLRLQTGKKLYREIDVEAGPGRWAGTATTTRRNGDRVRCHVSHRIDYVKNTVRVVVPRSCLARPAYVRATAANAWVRKDLQDSSQPDYVFLDNPHNTSDQANTWTRWIKRG